MSVAFVVNPRSAGGRTGRAFGEIESYARSVFGDITVHRTERPEHAIDIAADVGAGCELLVSVGGDGTANEVANGLARLRKADRPVLGVLPAGTGCDLVKSLGMPRELEAAIRFLKNGERHLADWMQVEMQSAGDIATRTCINVAGFGMNGEVVKRANESSKRFGGRTTFALATVKTALGWKPPAASVQWDGPDGPGSWSGPLSSVFVANGQFCGGGMWVGKGGSMSDGAAEMTLLPDVPLLKSIRNAPRLYTGTIREVEGVISARVSELHARCDEARVLVDVDGEQPGSLPLSIRVERHAVRLVAAFDE